MWPVLKGQGLGPHLRAARLRKKLSLRALADRAGVSASLLSQVENGKTQPSVSTLYALVSKLDLSLDQLLGLSPATPDPSGGTVTTPGHSRPRGAAVAIQHSADNPVLEMDNGVRWERLAIVTSDLVDPLLETYQPDAASSADGTMMTHNGVEYAYLLEGELTLHVEFDRYPIRPGDSFCFDSTLPHLYVKEGSTPARGLWFVVGRRTHAHTMQQVASPLSNAFDPPRPPSNAVEALTALDHGAGDLKAPRAAR